MDLDACYRSGRAGSADPLWVTALGAALAALARITITSAAIGCTARAHRRRRRRRAGAA